MLCSFKFIHTYITRERGFSALDSPQYKKKSVHKISCCSLAIIDYVFLDTLRLCIYVALVVRSDCDVSM